MKKAFITGVGGQDGSYLADILLGQGYQVHGLYRHSSKDTLQNVAHNLNNSRFILHQGDVTDALCLDRLIHDIDPHEIYHEADQDNVDWSFEHPAYQIEITVKAVTNLLSSVRTHCPSARVFIPCSATMFGDAPAPQNENTPFNPQSPYACAKVAAYHIARMYRQNYGMFVTTGILYNHDSPRRNGNYLLHKIAKAAVYQTALTLFNPEQEVAVGYAREYMQYVTKVMRLSRPDDYIIYHAQPITVKALVDSIYGKIWSPTSKPPTPIYTESSQFIFRSPTLLGDNSKLNKALEGLLSSVCPSVFLHNSIIDKYQKELK